LLANWPGRTDKLQLPQKANKEDLQGKSGWSVMEKRLAALAWEVGAKVAAIITKVVQVHDALWV